MKAQRHATHLSTMLVRYVTRLSVEAVRNNYGPPVCESNKIGDLPGMKAVVSVTFLSVNIVKPLIASL